MQLLKFFYIFIKNVTKLNIDTLWFDNHGGYTSSDFKTYMLDNDIKLQTKLHIIGQKMVKTLEELKNYKVNVLGRRNASLLFYQ